jgi:hypothetical protein
MRFDDSTREVLNRARYSIIEISSIRRTLDSVSERLYHSMNSSRLTNEAPGKIGDGDPRDNMIEQKDKLIATLRSVLDRHVGAITEAESIIEGVDHAGTRSAMRFYYLCGVKTWEEVADLCHCDPRTVRRWVGEKNCEK